METITYNNILFYKIKDFDNYYISKCGKVLSGNNLIRQNKYQLLTNRLDKSGYLVVGLNSNSYQKYMKLHRIIAINFIPNPENKPQVNHKNGIKTDNRIENLEWMTASENQKHSREVLKNKFYHPTRGKFGKDNPQSKKINQYDLEGNFIKTWPSISDINRSFKKGKTSSISKCCMGKSKSVWGFKWEYA